MSCRHPIPFHKYTPEGVPTERTEQITEWLDKPMKITLKDTRVLLGQFAAFDDKKNIIIRNTQQISLEGEPRLGLILVPWDHIVKVELAKNYSQ